MNGWVHHDNSWYNLMYISQFSIVPRVKGEIRLFYVVALDQEKEVIFSMECVAYEDAEFSLKCFLEGK